MRKSEPTWLVKQFSSTTTHPNYFKNMRFPRHSLIHRGAILNKNKYKLRASSCPNIYRVSMTTLVKDDDEVNFPFLSLSLSFHFSAVVFRYCKIRESFRRISFSSNVYLNCHSFRLVYDTLFLLSRSYGSIRIY